MIFRWKGNCFDLNYVKKRLGDIVKQGYEIKGLSNRCIIAKKNDACIDYTISFPEEGKSAHGKGERFSIFCLSKQAGAAQNADSSVTVTSVSKERYLSLLKKASDDSETKMFYCLLVVAFLGLPEIIRNEIGKSWFWIFTISMVIILLGAFFRGRDVYRINRCIKKINDSPGYD